MARTASSRASSSSCPRRATSPPKTSRSWRKDAGIKHVPLTIGESPDGPPDYEIAKDADITVLMWNEHKVKVNHAYKGELTDKDVRAIVADIPKVLSD